MRESEGALAFFNRHLLITREFSVFLRLFPTQLTNPPSPPPHVPLLHARSFIHRPLFSFLYAVIKDLSSLIFVAGSTASEPLGLSLAHSHSCVHRPAPSPSHPLFLPLMHLPTRSRVFSLFPLAHPLPHSPSHLHNHSLACSVTYARTLLTPMLFALDNAMHATTKYASNHMPYHTELFAEPPTWSHLLACKSTRSLPRSRVNALNPHPEYSLWTSQCMPRPSEYQITCRITLRYT